MKSPSVYKIASALDRKFKSEEVYAHCDIPCGIYDPYAAQLAAHTVIRMDMLIEELGKSQVMDTESRNKMIRYVEVKEQHAENVKHEVRVLWGDYFKPEHAEKFPELHGLVWEIMKKTSKCKQGTGIKESEELLEAVKKMAVIFWKTKGVDTVEAKSFYPTERTFVYPKV
jgi:nickel superoxide dismutase